MPELEGEKILSQNIGEVLRNDESIEKDSREIANDILKTVKFLPGFNSSVLPNIKFDPDYSGSGTLFGAVDTEDTHYTVLYDATTNAIVYGMQTMNGRHLFVVPITLEMRLFSGIHYSHHRDDGKAATQFRFHNGICEVKSSHPMDKDFTEGIKQTTVSLGVESVLQGIIAAI
jgi:hypothetical protein